MWPLASSLDGTTPSKSALAYSLEFSIEGRQNFGWVMGVDLTPDGLKILYFSIWAPLGPDLISTK